MKQLITTLLLILCSVTMAMGATTPTTPTTTMVTATLNGSVLTISPSTSSSTDLKTAVSNAVGYDDKASVTKVTITDNIVAGESLSMLFYNYSNLKSIEGLDKLNTEQVTNMSHMFYGCNVLDSLDLSGFDTEQVTNMSYMFYGCNVLASLDLSGFDTKQVKSMISMFDGCTSLESLDLSGFNTEQVTSMYRMFYRCSVLASLDLSGFDTEQVTNMSYMFYGCNVLASLDLSSFNTKQVKSMSSMFYGCTALAGSDLSGFDTEQVTDMSFMFYNCKSLSSLDLSGFDTKQVTNMSYMFNGCSSLSSLDLSGFDTEQVTNMSNMFYGCESLSSLDLSSFNTAQVTSINSMFSGVTLQTVTLSDSIQADIASLILLKDGYKWVKDGVTYDAIPLANDLTVAGTYKATPTTTMVTAILNDSVLTISPSTSSSTDLKTAVSNAVGSNKASVTKAVITSNIVAGENLSMLFYSYTNLKSIEGLDKLNTEKVTYMSNMFNGCKSLSSLDLSGFNTEKVTSMSSMFDGCESLSSLDLSGFNTEQVTSMSYMFSGCESLSNLDLSDFNTEQVTNMWSMFLNCKFLSSLDLSSFTTEQVQYMNNMFYGCSSLSSLDLSDFNTEQVTSMGYMFYGCESLESLDLSDFDTKQVTSINSMFSGVKLQTISLSSSIKAGIASQILLTDGYEWVKDETTYDAIPLANDLTVAGTYTAECIEYTITYNLNDGTNGSNPTTYTVESETITLADASKTGYTFAGWYAEATYETKVTTIDKGSIEDKVLYAKWAITLAYAKELKTDSIDTLNTYEQEDYRAPQWTELQAIFTKAKAEVEALTTVELVEAYDISGLTTFANAIKTDAELTAEELTTAKTNAKDTLSNYASADDYRTSEQETLATAITNGSTAIDNATDTTAVAKALSDAKTAIDTIKTDAQLTAEELTTAKTNAKDTLSNYASADDYRTSEQETLATAITNGSTAIDNATDTTAVAKALSDAKTAIDAIKTDAQLTAEELAVVYTVIYTDYDTINYTKASADITCPTLTKESVTADGKTTTYTFTGWYDGTTKVTTIPTGSTGNKTLVAKWTETVTNVEYVIIAGTDTISYTVEDEVTLPVLTKASDSTVSADTTTTRNYVFKGWLTSDGDTITTIEVGTTGNITLTPTWHTETVVGIIDQVSADNYNSDKLVVGPMPLTQKSKVFYTVEEDGVYTLELYNISEKLMAKTTVEANEGRNTTNWATLQMLPKGIYYIALKQDGKFLSLRRIVK